MGRDAAFDGVDDGSKGGCGECERGGKGGCEQRGWRGREESGNKECLGLNGTLEFPRLRIDNVEIPSSNPDLPLSCIILGDEVYSEHGTVHRDVAIPNFSVETKVKRTHLH